MNLVYIFSGISHRIHYIFRHISQNTLYFQTYLTEYIGYDSKKMLDKFSFHRYRVLNWFFPAPTDVTV